MSIFEKEWYKAYWRDISNNAARLQNFFRDIKNGLQNGCLSTFDQNELPDLQQKEIIFEIEEIRPHNPQLLGLRNLGNTCYLNSVLQILANTPLFIEKLSQNESEFGKQLYYVLSRLSAESSDADILNSLKKFRNTLFYLFPQFSESMQNDAKMLFAMISDQVESPIFSQKLQKTFKDKHDHTYIKEEINIFTIISEENLGFVQNYFDGYEERIFTFHENNRIYCEECDFESDMTMETEIIEYPKVLVLYYAKPQREIVYKNVPIVIEIKQHLYKLYGMICHRGSDAWGHYWAYVLNQDNTWVRYDDYLVYSEDNPDFMNAYLTFYDKIA